ncbi:MAG: hypothetical protein IKP64_08635 [Selenomonadaceae bacterium]|nr:hypothetical protein [Selenomonadaceae bacterium]MBR4383610.1 hypothetical protein [Selenomonadaceae bacterium]
MTVFTDFYEFTKIVRQSGSQLKCTTPPIKSLLETCARDMGYYFFVNKKVLDSYMRKNACEIWIDEKAALETIAELKS